MPDKLPDIQERNARSRHRLDVISAGCFFSFNCAESIERTIWRAHRRNGYLEAKASKMPDLSEQIPMIDGGKLAD
jgi:hypothetical protein